jgi:AraC-like DNA-binding protein
MRAVKRTQARSGDRNGLLAVAHIDIFQAMRVSASIVSFDPAWKITDTPQWRVLHVEPSVVPFELEHGVEAARYRYNGTCAKKASRTRKTVVGRLRGLCDLFVPIPSPNEQCPVLVVGPFATSRPTSADMLERWRELTGRQGHPADVEFAHYLSMTLETLVLDEGRLEIFIRFLSCMASLIAGTGNPRALIAQADSMRDELDRTRQVERMWAAARSMVDERTSRSWSSPHRASDRKHVGLEMVPDQVVVGLLVGLQSSVDPVDALMNRDAFQRACVELGRSAGGIICGQVGDHGVIFLSGTGGVRTRQYRRLVEVASKATVLARDRFKMGLYLGVSSLPSSAVLSAHYESALGAAESALSQRTQMLHPGKSQVGRGATLGKLRQQLAEAVGPQPETLAARFDRYVEAITLRSGYRLEATRAHLEAGLDRMSEALLDFEGYGLEDTYAELERAAREAPTVSDLVAAYRRAVADLSEALQQPAPAHQDRRIRRAVTYIHQHYGESLTLRGLARVAGFAPNYFSRLFRQRERMTVARYLRQVRIERAKQLLTHTDLEVKRVAQLSGFASQHYFARSFRRVVGTTPLAWRDR